MGFWTRVRLPSTPLMFPEGKGKRRKVDIVTVYFPNEENFEADMKTRKRC